LKNEVERLVIMTSGASIRNKDLRDSLSALSNHAHSLLDDAAGLSGTDLKSAKEKFERNYILQYLKINNWNVTQTAERLGIERSNLHRKMKQLGISASPGTQEK